MTEPREIIEIIDKPDMRYTLHIKSNKKVEQRLLDYLLQSVVDVFKDTGISAEVKPMKCGYWKDIMMSEATGWDLSLTGGRDAVLETVCSVCGNCCAFGGDGEDYLSPYCPNCGARMEGGING